MGGFGSGRRGRRGEKAFAEHDVAVRVSLLSQFGDIRRPDGTLKSRVMHNGRAIRVETTLQPSGGLRPWLSCPRCRRRCAVLYRARPEEGLASEGLSCRRCQRRAYSSQNVSCKARWRRQSRKLQARAGGDSWFFDDEPKKPKGMRWATFNRLIDRSEYYEFAVLASVFGRGDDAKALARAGRAARQQP